MAQKTTLDGVKVSRSFESLIVAIVKDSLEDSLLLSTGKLLPTCVV